MNDKDKILEEAEPLLADLADAFDLATVQATTIIDANFPNASDGYLRSTIIRGLVKEHLLCDGYSLARVANVGIEVTYGATYAMKVVRSDHTGNVPAPSTISRASWCVANQPRLGVGGMDVESFWSIKRLGLRGCGVDAVVLSSLGAQNDGLTHLILDWEEIGDSGLVRMAVSMPVGAWKQGETPRLAWRSVYERSDTYKEPIFVPSDEDIDFFIDGGNGESRLGVKVG